MSRLSTNMPNRQSRSQVAWTRPWGRWGLRFAAISYLGLMVALPITSLFLKGWAGGLTACWRELANPITYAALRLTVITAIITSLINVIIGTMTAYALTRFQFPGRALFNGLIDLPFAIPTMVAGVMMVVLYGPQAALGNWFDARGVKIIFAPSGIVLALLFVTYPFVIRAVQPVLAEVEQQQEEAAYTMGASQWLTFFRILLPMLMPAILSGALLSFARALGEFGAIVAVAGNMPGRTLTAPVHIYGQIESQNEVGASAVSIVLLTLSFILILAVDWLERRKGAWDANR
jgi:sulfate transport system permease protein